MGDVQRLGPHTYYLSAGAVVSVQANLADDFDKGRVDSVNAPDGSGAIKLAKWGKDNDLPQVREDLVSDNNIVPGLIETKRNIICGAGVWAYKKRYEQEPDGKMKTIMEEVEMPPEATAFFDPDNGTDLVEYLNMAAGELMKHGLLITEFVRNKDTTIKSFKCHESKLMRAEMKNDAGRIEHWYMSGFWGKQQKNTIVEKSNRKVIKLPVYNADPADPQPKFITVQGDFLFNDGYYPIPSWWGGWEWIELANLIPQFHKHNLQNGYSIRWHIEVPYDYFVDYKAMEDAAGDATAEAKVLKTMQEREKQFMNDINRFLAGLENSGRAVFTKYEIDKAMGKEFPGIKIKPLEFDMKDEALLKLFEKSNTAGTSAQRIHPTLANIETQGKLSSGTEIRNAYLMWLIINTPQPRAKMFRAVEMVKKINKWPADVFFGIRDFELTALSEDKSGMQQRNDQNPGNA